MCRCACVPRVSACVRACGPLRACVLRYASLACRRGRVLLAPLLLAMLLLLLLLLLLL